MTLPAILPLVGLEGITLKHGSHTTREEGVCLLEAVAWVAGEPHSDRPACACPIMAAIGRRLNDRISRDDDATRTALLRPAVLILVGSKATRDVERRRMYLALDWSLREIVPQWFDLVPSLAEYAAALRGLAPIVDTSTLFVASAVARKARAAADDAYDAAADAAYAAYAYAAAAYAKPIIAALIVAQCASAVDLLRRMAAIVA